MQTGQYRVTVPQNIEETRELYDHAYRKGYGAGLRRAPLEPGPEASEVKYRKAIYAVETPDGEWYDFMLIPESLDPVAERGKWATWIQTVYIPGRKARQKLGIWTFSDWLLTRGAKIVPNDTIEIIPNDKLETDAYIQGKMAPGEHIEAEIELIEALKANCT